MFGHDEDHAIALDRRRHGKGDAGVAAGGLDQRVARLDGAALLGAGDHRQRRPVLDRTGRVVALHFAQDDVAVLLVDLARDAHQAHQRRTANQVFDCLVIGR